MVSTVQISMNVTLKSIHVTTTLGVTTLMVTMSVTALRVSTVTDLSVPILTNALIPIFLELPLMLPIRFSAITNVPMTHHVGTTRVATIVHVTPVTKETDSTVPILMNV